ncbi:MAG: bifunctional phosphopantothenoylcysteine decarboxylase/phosphopantothenate--cysteine ligase CoaBC [Legionellales bacterium]|nr:bifunctional phosphopantothenoylcysteine decarboxylase/phosphopantothenate--cysteine ligase CoaBC [Legionellales bacterium]
MKRVLLGISAGIAAYKCPELIRRLRENQCDVQVMMTKAAHEFVAPLALQAVSSHPVRDDLFDPEAELGMSHIELARWPDLILLAPATANLIAKLAHGFADDLLTSVCLATTKTIAIAPAMNKHMWEATPTLENVERLKQRNMLIWGPENGEQACGDVGLGRMLAIEEIVEKVKQSAVNSQLFQGKKILITAGPTREAIDSVRYISNRSSGKMGFALARAAYEMGAEVILIAGPTAIDTPQQIQRINITTAQEMLAVARVMCSECDIFIGAAAVADYRLAQVATQKIASREKELTLKLIPNPDIIAEIAKQSPKPFCVGFAAQTDDVIEKALQKLKHKNLDMIIANDVSLDDRGFDVDNNQVTVIDHQQKIELSLKPKMQLAIEILHLIHQGYKNANRAS